MCSKERSNKKTPEVLAPGFLFVFGRENKPQADYQILLSIQPFADIIGYYTCHNRKHK